MTSHAPIILRDYQHNAISGLRNGFAAGHRSQLLQASTGAGKTIIAAEMIRSAIAKSKRCLFVAHRAEIIQQTSAKLDQFGIDHGVIMAGHPRVHPTKPVQVASIQTLTRRAKPKADLLILDECHLSVSKSFLDLVAEYPNAAIIGLTATPIRLDGRGLGQIYRHMVEVVPMARLIDDGHLVRPRVFAPFNPDLSGVATVRGDFDQQAVAEAMDKASITGDIVKHWTAHAAGRKTIAFAASVAHSEHIRDTFRDAGIRAEHLDGTTPKQKREATLAAWRRGDFPVLSNCGLFVEGLDVPEVSCCILARPTQSLTIYLQAVGRAMRPAPGKSDCIVLDHAGLTYRHGLVDDERDWTLDGRKQGKRKQSEEQAPSVTICAECFAAFNRQAHDACPLCGAELPARKRTMETDEQGELQELDRAAMDRLRYQKKQELIQARTKEQLVELGRRRGYKFPSQWAEHILNVRKSRQNWASSIVRERHEEATEILSRLESRGFHLTIAGSNIAVRPGSALTNDDRRIIRGWKRDLLLILSERSHGLPSEAKTRRYG